RAKLAYPIHAILGEGSLWDVDNQQLLWVDIIDQKIYAFKPDNASNTGFDIGQSVSSIVISDSGLWVFSGQNGIGFLNSKTGNIIWGKELEKENQGIRFNDGKCDPRGTFWAGTMSSEGIEGAGTLYE